MRSQHKKVSGFTLTELLLVVTLLGVAMLLVGPLTVQQIEKFQLKNEMFTLERLLKKLSFQAFVTAQPTYVYLQGKAVYLLSPSQLPANFSATAVLQDSASAVQLLPHQQPFYLFERVFFTEQLLSLNANGFYQHDVVQVQSGRFTEQLVLNPAIETLQVKDGR